MSYQREVCIDNIESLSIAQQGAATRIELCAALALGDLIPSGMLHYAGQAHMGSSAVDDFAIPVAGADNIAAVAQILKSCCV